MERKKDELEIIGLFLLMVPIVLFNFALEERGRKMLRQIEEQEGTGTAEDASRWVEKADEGEKWTSSELALGMMISLCGLGIFLFYGVLN